MSTDTPPHENLAKSRYTDLIGEPVVRLLSPIKGYEATPLVSLEQAATYIAHLFDGIEENVWIAKENSKNPADGLNQDESAAIHLYTMQFDTDPSFYSLLNSTLRGENRDNLRPWFAYLKLFLTALYKLPSHPQTIWRGVRGVDLSKQYPTGSKFAWWGVSSCTSSLEVLQAETFLGTKGVRTLFSLESQNGKIIVPHSYFKDTEKEIVLMPGTYFEVVGQFNPAQDSYIIQLKELEPPFAFVKPPFKRDASVQKSSIPPHNVVLPPEPPVLPKVSANEGVSSTTTAAVTGVPPPSNRSKARVASTTLPRDMEEPVVDIIRDAIAEGTNQKDIEEIVADELNKKYGRAWTAKVTPRAEEHGGMTQLPFLYVKIDDYGVSVFQYQNNGRPFASSAAQFQNNPMHYGGSAAQFQSNPMNFGGSAAQFQSNPMNFGNATDPFQNNPAMFGTSATQLHNNLMKNFFK